MTLEAEVRLIRWSESSTAGRTITIELPPDAGEGHPFKGFPTGHAHGQRFQMSFVPIGDDENHLEQNTAKAELRAALLASEAADRKNPTLSLVGKQRYAGADEMERAVTRSALLTKDPQFIAWAAVHDETEAVIYIRDRCGVQSRSEIATNEDAFQSFLRLEREFLVWAGRAAENRA
jgi:hypothetical protein